MTSPSAHTLRASSNTIPQSLGVFHCSNNERAAGGRGTETHGGQSLLVYVARLFEEALPDKIIRQAGPQPSHLQKKASFFNTKLLRHYKRRCQTVVGASIADPPVNFTRRQSIATVSAVGSTACRQLTLRLWMRPSPDAVARSWLPRAVCPCAPRR